MAFRDHSSLLSRRRRAGVFARARGLHAGRSVRSDEVFNSRHVRQQDEAERSARAAISQWRSRHHHRRAGGSGQGLSTAARSDRRGCLRNRTGSRPQRRSRRQSRNPSLTSRSDGRERGQRRSKSRRRRSRRGSTSVQRALRRNSLPTRPGRIRRRRLRSRADNSPGRRAISRTGRTGAAGRAALAIGLAGAAANRTGAACGCAIGRIKFAKRASHSIRCGRNPTAGSTSTQ